MTKLHELKQKHIYQTKLTGLLNNMELKLVNQSKIIFIM